MSKSLLHNLGRFSALLIALSLSLTHLCDSRIDSHLILADSPALQRLAAFCSIFFGQEHRKSFPAVILSFLAARKGILDLVPCCDLVQTISNNFSLQGMDTPAHAKLSSRQQQRVRKRIAHEKLLEQFKIIVRAHQKEVKKLQRTISNLRAVTEDTEARSTALARSSAIDAISITDLREQRAKLISSNQKWTKEGLRVDILIKRLRAERDLSRSQLLVCRATSPHRDATDPSSPPLTPRTPGRESPSP
jgi:hypothetical protein